MPPTIEAIFTLKWGARDIGGGGGGLRGDVGLEVGGLTRVAVDVWTARCVSVITRNQIPRGVQLEKP